MDNSPAPQAQSDTTNELIKLYLQAVQDGKDLSAITEIVSQEVQTQVEQTLVGFGESVRQTNLTAIEIMAEELVRIKAESETVSGFLERLKAVAAPDLANNSTDEVVSYQQAINNLEQYGSIIPSNGDIAKAYLNAQRNQAWSLLWQSVIKLIIKQIQIRVERKKS